MHDNHSPNEKLSSASYVPATMKAEHEGPAAKIRIRKPQNCDHTETVCVHCVRVWEYDWKFHFARTAGGRRLASERV